MQLFTSGRISVDMSTTTPAITAASFEKVFVRRCAASITHIQRHTPPDEHLVAGEKYQDLANWREIAWKALEKKKLGDSLRRAIVSLPIKYREVLFLRDVKNLDTSETAWILNITAGAVRARLMRARMQVYSALASSLLMRARDKSLVNCYRLFRGTVGAGCNPLVETSTESFG
jgi:RNA polymerase sigma factor (sigma-70 family)